MGCNWELFEFRMALYQSSQVKGDQVFGTGMTFFQVSFDHEEFEGQNDFCDFKPGFLKIAGTKLLRFSFLLKQLGSYDPINYFDLLRRTSQVSNNPLVYPAAVLWVHRKDTKEHDTPGPDDPRILMEKVDVDSVNYGKMGHEYISDIVIRFKVARLAGKFR